MRDDSSENNSKTMWQNQPTKASAMTLEKIREKAGELHAKRRRQLLSCVAAPLGVGFFYAFGINQFLLWSFGPILLAIGTFIVAMAMVGTRQRGIFPNGLPFLTLG